MIQRSLFYRQLTLAATVTVATAGVFAAVSTVTARSAHDESQSRPIVLLVHGRGQFGRDTADIRTEWQRSLETGLGKLTRQPLIDSSDVRLVWYADVLDPASSAGCNANTGS